MLPGVRLLLFPCRKNQRLFYISFFPPPNVVYFAFYGLFIPCPLFYTPKALKGFQWAFFRCLVVCLLSCPFTGFFLLAFSFLPLPRFRVFYGLIWCRVRHGWRRLLFLSVEVFRPSIFISLRMLTESTPVSVWWKVPDVLRIPCAPCTGVVLKRSILPVFGFLVRGGYYLPPAAFCAVFWHIMLIVFRTL